MPKIVPASVTALAMLAVCGAAAACEYSVRDVAFVDLGVQRYQLLVFERGAQAKQLADLLTPVASEVLADANVTAAVVDLDDQPNHPALALLESPTLERLPLYVLVSPDGRVLPLEWDLPEDATDADLRELLASVVTSPRRTEIIHSVVNAHSVILLIGGANASVNVRNRQTVDDAVRQVRDSLDQLPKPIARPPRVVAMESDEAAKEKILLWSLGIEPPGKDQTRVAVLVGRGRIIGPAVTLPDGQQQLLTNLAAVGQDCECGLDRSWMQGEMIPHIWSTVREAEAMKDLGFDPGDPLVKAEISRILERGRGAGRLSRQSPQASAVLPELGYQEIPLDALQRPADDKPAITVATPIDTQVSELPDEVTEPIVAKEIDAAEPPSVAADQPPSTPDPDVRSIRESPSLRESPFLPIVIVLSAVGLVALVGAGVILLRGRRGASA